MRFIVSLYFILSFGWSCSVLAFQFLFFRWTVWHNLDVSFHIISNFFFFMCLLLYSAASAFAALHPSVHRSISVIYCSFVDVALSLHSFILISLVLSLCVRLATYVCMLWIGQWSKPSLRRYFYWNQLQQHINLLFEKSQMGVFWLLPVLFGSELLLVCFFFSSTLVNLCADAVFCLARPHCHTVFFCLQTKDKGKKITVIRGIMASSSRSFMHSNRIVLHHFIDSHVFHLSHCSGKKNFSAPYYGVIRNFLKASILGHFNIR